MNVVFKRFWRRGLSFCRLASRVRVMRARAYAYIKAIGFKTERLFLSFWVLC